jgi:hypothetical protein
MDIVRSRVPHGLPHQALDLARLLFRHPGLSPTDHGAAMRGD